MIYCRQHFVLLESTGPEMSSGNASSKVGFSLNTCSRSTNRGVMCSKPTEWCWYWHQSLRPCWYGSDSPSINQYAGHIQVLFDERNLWMNFDLAQILAQISTTTFILCHHWLVLYCIKLATHISLKTVKYLLSNSQIPIIGQSRAFDYVKIVLIGTFSTESVI